MEEKAQENSLETINAGIAALRAEIAALTAEFAEWKIDTSAIDGERPQKGLGSSGGWTSFRSRIGEVGTRGEQIAAGLAHEIERHPLIGGMAAFGLGFVIAKLLFKRSKRDSGQ